MAIPRVDVAALMDAARQAYRGVISEIIFPDAAPTDLRLNFHPLAT